MKNFNEMVNIFEQANVALLQNDQSLFTNQVSERTLCGALMLHLKDIIRDDESFSGYYLDVEYNRNTGSIKTIFKTVRDAKPEFVIINCDLILHSRGEHVEQDNLIAIEMKKSTRSVDSKNKDRKRLIALTKDSFDDVWAFNGKNFPEHVCRYVLGVYYEINYRHKRIDIEYYHKGKKVKTYSVKFDV